MGGGKRVALAASVAVMCLPGTASATTATLGNPNLPTEAGHHFGCPPCELGAYTLAQLFSPGVDFAPAAGRITSWRVTGSATGGGALKLRVLEGGPEGGWIGRGTSAPATSFRGLEGPPNATSLPIDHGDAIGVDLTMNSTVGDDLTEGEAQLWTPPILDGEERNTVPDIRTGNRIMLNAEEVLTPVVTLLSPASGGASGGNGVKIAGLYLDSATGVTFGSTPASSFSVDSSNQITAIAPASTASTVDVRVTGPGGSSEVSPADSYTFTTPAATSPITTTAVAGGPAVKPTVTGFSESSSRWRRGRSLPHIASGAPVGTTFSFSLNEPASVNLTFTQSVSGRRVAGRCVAPGHRNAGRPRCKRTLLAGSFTVPGHAGLDKVGFQGRVSGTKTLKPGSYLVSVTAREAHGLRVVSRSLSFTIIS